METLDLELLACGTAQALNALWDELGVEQGERATALAHLSADVAAIYESRVAAQQARKMAVESEISQLQSMIEILQNSVEEVAPIVRTRSRELSPCSRCVSPHRHTPAASALWTYIIELPKHAGGATSGPAAGACEPRNGFASLSPHPIAPRPQTWDIRYNQMKSLEGTMFELCTDIGSSAEVSRNAAGNGFKRVCAPAHPPTPTPVRPRSPSSPPSVTS